MKRVLLPIEPTVYRRVQRAAPRFGLTATGFMRAAVAAYLELSRQGRIANVNGELTIVPPEESAGG